MTVTHSLQRPTIAAALLATALVLGACNRDAGTPASDAQTPPGAPAATDRAMPAETAPTDTTPAQAPAGIAVSDVLLGTRAEGATRVAEPKTTFAPSDRTIVASVLTDATAPASGTLRARWTYQDGQLVDETSQPLDASGAGVTNFRIDNQEDWPTGTYTLEVSVDGEVVETREFTVE